MEYFDNPDDYFGETNFNQIPQPDYSVGVVLKNDHNNNPLITANLSGKTRVRRERVDQVSKLFEEHFLKKDVSNVVYRFHFRGIGWRTYKLKNKDQMETMFNSLKNYGSLNVQEVSYSASSSFYEEHELPKIEFVDYLRIEIENLNIKDSRKRTNKDKSGGFYPYYIDKEVDKNFVEDLLQYFAIGQIYDSLYYTTIRTKTIYNKNGDKVKEIKKEKRKEREEFKFNCFCYALIMSGKVSKELINQIQDRCYGVYIKINTVKELCSDLNIRINLVEYVNDNKNKYRKTIINPNGEIVIDMGLIREEGMKGDHYIYNKELPIKSYFLKHYDEMIQWANEHNKEPSFMYDKDKFDKRRNCYCKNNKNGFIRLFDLIIFAKERGWFKPYSLNDVLTINTNFDRYIVNKEIETLEYNDNCIKPIFNKKPKKKNKEIHFEYYYADFEASTQGYHKPYCVSFSCRDEDVIQTIYGYGCEEEFLNRLPNYSVVYFHNLAYDGRFLARFGIRKAIKKAGKILSMELLYRKKIIYLRDSYAMITSPLKAFPNMFDIKGIQKELYNYNYYTEERVKSNVGLISEAGKFETVPWTENDYKLFNENINSIEGCRIDEDHYNMELYCKFYCEQDVNILKQGHMKFKELVEQELNLNIDESISISSLANKYFTQNIYSKINNLYQYSGHLRKFIQGCVKGGRCMTRQNKKWHCTERLYDYDACSLYPSAVYRLKLATGKPKVIPKQYLGDNKSLLKHLMDEQQLIPTKEKFISAFIVDIEITKVGKELAFPIIMYKTKKGNVNCNETGIMRVDNIELEDLIKFQQIEFKILRGYYWNGAKSDLFSNEMKRIYDLRVQYKKEKNPLQNVLKLLMNSTYGKTIQLEIKTEQIYKFNERYEVCDNGQTFIIKEAARFNRKNNKNIKEYYAIDRNITCFEVEKGFDDFYVPNFIGVQILSMSKRIMNEVMCLAEDLGIMIYYQDTDSMHIPVKDVPKLEQKYKEIYGRELRGSDMGQFHPDFESDKIKGDLQSVESYFLGKKAYCDKLQNENNEIDYHLRLKGIPNDLLSSEYEDPLELYKKLYNGEAYKFNLLKLKPSFEMGKNMTIKSRSEFNRQIKF